MSTTKEEVIEFISNMSVLELSELIKEMEEKFGVSAAAPTAVAAAPGAETADGSGEAEAKTEFDVVLTSAGDKRINVIKEVRTITALGLKEAKALVEGAPAPIKESVSKDEADEIKAKIEEAGGSVEIK